MELARKGGTDYFALLTEMSACSCRAAEKLEHILDNYQHDSIQKHLADMHQIENSGDILKHEMVEKLAKEFITPIEREDIMAIAGQIDDVTDSVEDVLLKLYMFNIKTIQPKAVEFAGIIRQCCDTMLTMFRSFSDFKKSRTIHEAIIELNRLEELGDALYIEGVHQLHTGGADALEAYCWTEVFNRMEKCCDTCEHTADLVENVIMKNS